jgi:hypothetical protein
MRDEPRLFRNILRETREDLGELGSRGEFVETPAPRVVLYGLLTESDASELHRRKVMLANRRLLRAVASGAIKLWRHS